MFPTPQPSPMKYRRGRPSSFALFTQNLASSSSSSSSSPPSAILEAEVPTTTNQVEVAPSIVSSGSFATSSNSGNLIPALALQSSRPLTKKGLPKGKGKNFDPPSSSPLAIATTPTSGSNTTTTTTTTTGTAKKSTNLMEAATLLQTTLNSSPNHTRRRRRQTTLAAKTETLGAALETLRQKRREEAAGLIQLLKSRAGALGSYGKELRKYRGGEGEEEEGRGFGEDDFIDEEEGGGGGGGHNDEETADERDNVRGRSRDVYEGEEEGDIFPTPRLSTAASFLSDGRLEEEEDDEDLEEETEEEVKEAVETDMDYTPSGMVPTVIAGRRRKGKQTKLGKMADNELGGSAKRRRKEGDAEQGLTPTAKKRKSPSLRQQVEYSPVLYKTQSSDGGFGQYLPGESEGRRQRLRTRSELIGQEKELYYSNVDTAFMLTSAAELLLGRQDSFGDEMSVEGEKKEDGDDVGNDAMEVDGSASAEDRKGLDLLALALGFS
ncbi:hypothetical protein BDR26DRAFT_856427 [Obelidium mucronatum]|nr:hypothetical protein BDR26DRAFT_856427 [Obelidium mucronatum]